MRRLLFSALLLLGTAAGTPTGNPPRLRLPLACALGQDCFVQNYPDDDRGAGVRDHACGGRSYDGHDGTDIRLRDLAAMTRGVDVLAAAPGTVLRVRNDMPDRADRADQGTVIDGRECGNGLVIDHGNGWTTQYCHMAMGSVIVQPGRRVTAGQPLGKVGLSGNTEFPHLHLSVMHGGMWVDPFAWNAGASQCGAGSGAGGGSGQSLWAAPMPYRRGEVLSGGFADHGPKLADVEAGGTQTGPAPTAASPLVAYALAIGLEKGDIPMMVLTGPDGKELARGDAVPVDHDKAQFLSFAGRRAPPGGWAAGTYRADYSLIRGGTAAAQWHGTYVIAR